MIYYTRVGQKSDTTHTGGETPACPRLPAPRTACGRDENEQKAVRMADGADTTPDDQTAA